MHVADEYLSKQGDGLPQEPQAADDLLPGQLLLLGAHTVYPLQLVCILPRPLPLPGLLQGHYRKGFGIVLMF